MRCTVHKLQVSHGGHDAAPCDTGTCTDRFEINDLSSYVSIIQDACRIIHACQFMESTEVTFSEAYGRCITVMPCLRCISVIP